MMRFVTKATPITSINQVRSQDYLKGGSKYQHLGSLLSMQTQAHALIDRVHLVTYNYSHYLVKNLSAL